MADNAALKTSAGSSSDEEEEVFTYRLRIHDAHVEDGGKWRCEVKDKYGTISTSCDLEIFENEQIKKAIAIARQESMAQKKEEQRKVDESEEQAVIRPLEERLKKYDEYVDEQEPRFLQSLRNCSVIEDGVARLSCIVSGNPKPQTKWYKDNIEIKSDGRYDIVELRDGTNYLEFPSISLKDSAIYKCEITSDIGQSSSEAKLTVKKKKKYSHIFKACDLDDHREMLSSLQQRISDNMEYSSTIETTGYKHRNEINMMKSLYATEREADLKLRCKWEEEQQLYFRNNLNNKCVVDSGSVLLRCYVVGKPPFRARWFKDGKMLSDNIYERHFIRTRGGSMSLEIPCATLSDTGEYMCEARNEQGRVTSTCYLQVEPKFDTRIEYEKPYFVQKLKHIHVHPGQDATFTCVAKGNPKPGIIWYKDGKEIQNTSRITFHRQNNGGILKIHEARYSDTGLYKCEAHSMAGRAVSSAKLIVVESNGFLADFHCNHDKVELTSTSLREMQELEEEISAEQQEVTFKETVSSVIFPRMPSFKSQLPECMEIKEGERLVLSCRVDGFPKPQVTWLRNSEVIKESGSIYTLSEKGVHTLKIQNCVSERDAGVYTVRLNEGSKYQIESTCHVGVSGTISFKQALPKTMQAKEGEKLVLRFHAEGNPKPKVVWSFNSEKLREHCRTYTEGDSFCLEIATLDSKRDSGVYIAKITSGATEKICKCEVQVVRAPTFSKFLPKYVQVENGSKLHLQCTGDGYPKPEATWFRNNKELEADGYLKMESSGDTYSLDIPKTECKRDSGGYIIRLTSGTFSCESSSHVDVTRAPTFLSSIPANLDISEGERLTLKCVVDGVPPPEVSWFRDGVELVHGDYLQITSMEGRHTLQINKTAGNRDGGEYTVKLTTGTSQTEASCKVVILREPGFATLLPAEVQVQNGEKLLLECMVEGSPLPKVSWLYDGTSIRESDYVTIKSVDGKNSLEIANADFRRDSGKYTVKVVGRSKAECTCNVDIKSGPIFTKELPEVVQVGLHESLILKCNVDGNPIPQATWLHYGKEIKNSDIFQISSKENTHMLQITDPVYPRDCGVYTVKLTSEKGKKESSCNVDIMRAASFKQKMVEMLEVATGEKLLLSCSVDGLPKPDVVWLHNGKELKDADYVKFNISNDIYTMEIAEPQWKRDSGTYTAKLSTSKTKEESTCEVQIKSDPVFSTPLPSTLQVKEGESIKLVCNAEGNPTPKVIWLHNGKEIDNVEYAKVTSDGDKYVLKIVSPDYKRDSGTYTVKLTGGSTSKESTCELQIERKATITEQLPKDASVKEGEKLCLSCKADGFPLPEVIWLRNGKEIKDESYVKFGFADGSYTMEISNPDYKRDSGTYTAKLVGKDSETTCDVQILSPPKFSKPLSSEAKVKEGEKLVLTCTCEGNPKPEVVWLLDGKELSSNDYLNMKVLDDVATLEIASPDGKRDSGKYTARLKSASSTEECSCDVKISSPPVFSKQPLEKVQVKGSESLKLSCTVDGYPKPEVIWMHNDNNLKDADYVTLSCTDNTYTLEIKAPEYERDSGSYTIKLCGESKTVECKCDVELPKPPSFKKSLPTALDVTNGKPIALNCFIEGWPVPEVVWFHNDKKVESNERIQITSSEDMSTLEITKCSYPDDCGKYTAKIANSKDGAECSCTVNILSAPFFTAKLPENMEVDEGETISLKCRFDGNPKPQVKWLYNSNEIQQNEKAKITSGDNENKLEISNPQFQKDSGSYAAQIKNNFSEETSVCKVAVVTKGKTEETKEVIEQVEEPIEELQQQQFETVQKEENKDKTAQSITPIIVICKDHQLSAAKIGDLPEFLESPSFKVPLNKEYYPLEMDENVRIECTVSGDPCPEVTWKKDGIPLDRSTRVKTWFDPDTRLASVIIKRLKAEDSGEYECVATSQGGTSVSKTTLHVKFLEMQKVETQLPPENSDRRRKPNFILPIKDVALQAGQSGKLECLFEGIPLPAIKWFKDGSEFLSIPGKVSINVTEGKASLEIISMESRYAGVYTCEATNIEGSTSVSANINFKDAKLTKDVVDSPKGDPCKPVFIEALEENVTVPAGGSVAFKCSASGYPTPKFRWQKDLLDVVQSNRFIIETKIPGKSMLAIYNLKEQDSGLYICTARNSYGRTTCATNLRVTGDLKLPRRMTWSEDAIQSSMKMETRKRSESIQMTSIQNGFRSKARQLEINSNSLLENIEVSHDVSTTYISSEESYQFEEHITETQNSNETGEVFVTSLINEPVTAQDLHLTQTKSETTSQIDLETKLEQKEETSEMSVKSTDEETKALTTEDKRKGFQRKASDQDTTSEGVYVDVDETGRTVIKSEVHQMAIYSPRKSIITIDTGVEFYIDCNNQQTSELESKEKDTFDVLEGGSSISRGEDADSVGKEDQAKLVEDVVDSGKTPKTENPVQEDTITEQKQKQQETPVEKKQEEEQIVPEEEKMKEEPPQEKAKEVQSEKVPSEALPRESAEEVPSDAPSKDTAKEIPSDVLPKETAKEIPSEALPKETAKEIAKEIPSEASPKETAKEISLEEKSKEVPSETLPKTTNQTEDTLDGNAVSKVEETDKASFKKEEEKSSATLLQEHTELVTEEEPVKK